MVERTATSQPQLADNRDRLRGALGANQRGLFPEAEELYAAVLASQPDNFDALRHRPAGGRIGRNRKARRGTIATFVDVNFPPDWATMRKP
jgi:hypothetical protein